VTSRESNTMILNTPLKKQSLQKMAYEALRRAILERELQPGEQINIKQLAEKLSVSTMPIREALRQFEVEGMVSFKSNKRIVVNQLSLDEISDIYDIRIPLEEMAILKCCDREDKAGLARLEKLHRQMTKPGVIGTEWFNLNRNFHMLLHEMSGSARLFQILRGLWDSTGPYLRIFSEDKDAVSRANQEHTAILEALRENDKKLAKKTIRSHLRNGLKAVKPYMDESES